MQSVISNDFLSATVRHHGAELCSLKNKDGVEFIWQADKNIWPRHAPVLFPIVGRLKDDAYYLDHKKYRLPQHGFARDKNFELTGQSQELLSFVLKADEKTLSVYPFRFELHIRYGVHQGKITVDYEVINRDTVDMPFSIGAHPAFCCPVGNEGRFEDYRLKFSQMERLETAVLMNGLFTKEKKLLSENNDTINLDANTFINDALVFQNLQSESISLQSLQSANKITVMIKDFPYLGLWSKTGAPFVCIEPWHGKADNMDYNQNIFEKEGIIILKPGQSFKCCLIIEVSSAFKGSH